jgi:hypothetical protein
MKLTKYANRILTDDPRPKKDEKKTDLPFQAELTAKSKAELYDALSKDYQDPSVPIHPRIKNWLADFYGRVWQENYGVGTADKDKTPFTEDWTAMTEGISGLDEKGNVPFGMGKKTTKEDVANDIVGKTGVPTDIRYKSKAEVHFHPSEYLRDGNVMISGHQNPSNADKDYVKGTRASNHFVLGEDGRLYVYGSDEDIETEVYSNGEYYYGVTPPRPDRLIRNFLSPDDIKNIRSKTRLPAKSNPSPLGQNRIGLDDNEGKLLESTDKKGQGGRGQGHINLSNGNAIHEKVLNEFIDHVKENSDVKISKNLLKNASPERLKQLFSKVKMAGL